MKGYFYRPQRSWGKVIFSVVCVKNSVHGWGVPGQVTPRQVHALGMYTPRQVQPPGRYTIAQPQGRYSRPGQVHSQTAPPPSAVHAGRYGQQAGIRILLECILVNTEGKVYYTLTYVFRAIALLTYNKSSRRHFVIKTE